MCATNPPESRILPKVTSSLMHSDAVVVGGSSVVDVVVENDDVVVATGVVALAVVADVEVEAVVGAAVELVVGVVVIDVVDGGVVLSTNSHFVKDPSKYEDIILFEACTAALQAFFPPFMPIANPI